VEQRTEEWFAAKLGKASASHVSDILAKTKSGYSATRKNYMMKLLCERLKGKRQEDTYVSRDMERGTEREPLARSAYEAKTGVMVEEVGFIDHPTIPMFGASPDGLVGEDGCIEIKCPLTAQHVDLLTGGNIDTKYIYQMQTQMACTGRKWCDFVDYDSDLIEELSLFIRRIPRDEAMIGMIEEAVIQFNAELDALIEQLQGLTA